MSAKNSQLAKAQEEADEVKVIMLDNMQKTEERKFKLQELDERADQLQMKSKAFQKTSVKLKKKKRCDNIKAKWKLIAVVSSMALIIFLVAVFILVNRSGDETHGGNHPTHKTGINPTTTGPPN